MVDAQGKLPRDRREANLFWFKFDREREVRALRDRLPGLRVELKAATDKAERKDLREKIARDVVELAHWLSIASLAPEEMCSECPTPLVGHGWVSIGLHGARPCPAWPGWAARMTKVRAMFAEMVERNRQPAPPPPPKPEPIAVIPSGLPVSEVVARLSELHPRTLRPS
ncbi:hypothetical protein [Microbacterium sp. 22296]|uniref:hypothetical protein n=1 Tax=Microbacterium sp. 22296 TaxID=3453903 RepID=UPI003F833800